MVRILGTLVGIAAIGLILAPANASLYQPDEPMLVPVRPDGVAEALPFDEFRSRMVTITNIGDPTPLPPDGKVNRDRARVLARVQAAQDPRKLSADDASALAADWLRLGNDPGLYVNKAIDLLAPRTRDRNQNYFVFNTLAAVHASRGEFREAIGYQDDALIDYEMPAAVKGWSETQRNWIRNLDREYLPHYYRIRAAEMEPGARSKPEADEPTPLFPLPVKGKPAVPVRFVNDAGTFEPGTLAKAERDKLPPDAVAIVQQLLFWFPTDSRLYWLLAELYAADGKLDEASVIFEQCTWARKYTRKLLMEHHSAITSVLDERRKAAEKAAIDSYPVSLRAIWIYFGAVVLVAVIAVVRVMTRRGGKGRAMSCCG